MKNIFKSLMLVAVAAMGFACQEKVEDFTPERANEVVMTITADVEETRTYIDEANGKVAWSAGDKLMVIENDATFKKTSDIAIDGEGKAQFTVSFPKHNKAVTYNAIYPATAVDAYDSSAEEVNVQVKNTQFATAESFDPTADVLVAKQIELEAQPTELNMQFKRLVSLGKLTLEGLEANSLIKQVTFTAGANDVLAGRNLVNATTGDVFSYGESDATNTITVNYEEAISTNIVYFVCNPFSMEAGEVFTVQVICENAVYTREVEIPAGRSLKFTEGNLATFSVDMSEGDKKEVSAATSITDTLTRATTGVTGTSYTSWSGKTGNSGAVYAGQSAGDKTSIQLHSNNSNSGIVTTASGGNVRKISLTWQSDTSDGRTLDIYGSNTAYTNPTQLYSTSTQGTKLGSIVKGSGKATELEITGDYAFIGMRSNSGAMYITEINIEWQSGSGSGESVEIVIPSFDLDKRQLSFDVEGGSQVITVEALNGFNNIVSAETDVDWLTVENAGTKFTVTAKENEGFARTANVVFSADGCEDIKVVVSQDANPNAAIEATVAEFLAAKESDTTLYRLRGTITNVAETSFGNFDLTDETGTVYIYGLCSPEGTTKYWAASGAQLGDDIEIITVRSSYSNTPQGKNATFVEKQRPGTIAFWSFEKTSASFTSEGGVAEIKVAAYNLKEDIALEFKAGEDGDLFEADYDNGVLTISAEANSSTNELNATLYVRSGDLKQEITISQAAYVDGDAPAEPAKFVKVASAPSDWSGTYLIVYESGKLAFDGSRTKLDAGQNGVSVSISNNEIEATDEMMAIAFTVESSGDAWVIKSASGYYIGNDSNSNALSSNTTTKYLNYLTYNSGNIDVKSKGGAFLRYNATSGTSNERFRYYKSSTYTSQKAIQFYKLVN